MTRSENEMLPSRSSVWEGGKRTRKYKGVSQRTLCRRCFAPFSGTGEVLKKNRYMRAALIGQSTAVPGDSRNGMGASAYNQSCSWSPLSSRNHRFPFSGV